MKKTPGGFSDSGEFLIFFENFRRELTLQEVWKRKGK